MRHDPWRAQRFYRDPQHGKLMGVCAGLADYFGWNATLVRVLAIVALLWFNVVTLAVYLVLGFVLLAVGLIGEYVGRIYLEVRRRPTYIVRAVHGDEPDPPERR